MGSICSMIKHYLITAAYFKRYSRNKMCSALIKYYSHPLDSETANGLLRTNCPFVTVAVNTISLREAKFVAKKALEKELADG
jgi:hypothetical protein